VRLGSAPIIFWVRPTDGTINRMSPQRLSDRQIIDAYVYLIARYIVIRQEHMDLAEEGVDYNTIKFNELGRAEFVSPNLDVAYLECWFAVDEDTPVMLTVPEVENRYYTAQRHQHEREDLSVSPIQRVCLVPCRIEANYPRGRFADRSAFEEGQDARPSRADG